MRYCKCYRKSSLAIVHSLQSVRSVSVGLSLFQDYDASVLIRHGETINQNLGRIGLCDFKGGTPLYTALLAGAYQLSQHTEIRKVLIILSDLREREIDSYSRQAIKDLTKAGIIVVGITIGDSKAAEYTIVKMSTWYDYAVCELKAQYYFVGTYLVFTNFKNIDIRKRNLAGRFDYAFNWKFDKFGIRNRAYAKKYGVMKTTRLLNQSKDYVRIASRKPVKIYKNKSKKK